MKHYRKCQKKRPSVRLKRLPASVIDSGLKRLVNGREDSGHIHTVKNTARKSFSGDRKPIVRDPEIDRVIDELLEDSEDDIEEVKPVQKSLPPNSIVTFSSGFRTLEVPKIKEEVNMDTNVKNVNVPRPLPELQKIYVKNPPSSSSSQAQNKEIAIVDLCSSDED